MDFRTLNSIEQVRSMPGYRANNPVHQHNYKTLAVDYQLKAQERCCHLRDDGSLCRRLHNHGYVVQLADDSISIIGNDCANRYFDAESQFTKDRALFANQKRRQESLLRLRDLLAEKKERMEILRNLDQQLRRLQTQMKAIESAVGSQCMGRLRAMAKDGRREVIAAGIRIRPYVEDGAQRRERTEIPITIGALQGLSIVRPGAVSAISERVRAIARAFHKAEQTVDSAASLDLENLVTSLSDFASLKIDCGELEEAAQAFWSSELSVLSFLVDDPATRIKIIQHALNGISANQAKRWLTRKEQELKVIHRVDKIEVRM